jgi:hypothetical protein
MLALLFTSVLVRWCGCHIPINFLPTPPFSSPLNYLCTPKTAYNRVLVLHHELTPLYMLTNPQKKPLPIPTRKTTCGKNIDHLIKMHRSTDSTSDEEPIASMKSKQKEKKMKQVLQQSITFHQTKPSQAC